jgi:CubicO group peptidase (beta-lactamase class C family)
MHARSGPTHRPAVLACPRAGSCGAGESAPDVLRLSGTGVTVEVGMGLNKDGLDRFGAVAASHVGEDKVPGLVTLLAYGDDVHVEALGALAVAGRSVERASLLRIASTTKPITAAATLAVVREGLLDLDEPVDRLLPELANRRVLRRMDGPSRTRCPPRVR